MPFQLQRSKGAAIDLGRMRIRLWFFWLHIRTRCNCFCLCWLIHVSQCLHYSLMGCSSLLRQFFICMLSHYTGSIFVTTQESIRRNYVRYRVYHFQEYRAHRSSSPKKKVVPSLLFARFISLVPSCPRQVWMWRHSLFAFELGSELAWGRGCRFMCRPLSSKQSPLASYLHALT